MGSKVLEDDGWSTNWKQKYHRRALHISQVRWRRADKTEVGFSCTENGLASGFYEVVPSQA